MQPTGYEAERQAFIRRPLYLPRTEHAGRIAVEQQAQQDFWRVGRPAAFPVVFVAAAQVQFRDHLHHETRHMIGRQGIFHCYRHFQGCFVINGFEPAAFRRHRSGNLLFFAFVIASLSSTYLPVSAFSPTNC